MDKKIRKEESRSDPASPSVPSLDQFTTTLLFFAVQQVLERGCSGLGEGTGRQWKELGEGCCNVVPSAEDSDAIWVTRV